MASVSRKRQADDSESAARTNAAGKPRGAAASRRDEVSAAERLNRSIDSLAHDVRDRTIRAGQDLARQRDNLHGCLRQNPGWRTMDAASRQAATDRIDRFIDQQRQHVQDRWDTASDFAEQLDEIASALADDQQAERDRAAAPTPGLETRHAGQSSALADLAKKTEEAVANLMSQDDDRLKDERSAIAAALAKGSGEAIEAAFRKADESRGGLQKRVDTDLRVLEQHVDRAGRDILGKLTKDDAAIPSEEERRRHEE